MKTFTEMPMNLQFFADGGEGASGNQAGTAQEGTQSTMTTGQRAEAQGAPAQQVNQAGQIPANLADTLIQALEARTARAEKSVTRSIAEQYGVSEEELTGIVNRYKAEKANQLPEAAQKQIREATEKAHGMMIAAEVRAMGAQMGLVDAETALLLLDKSKVSVSEDGKVEGVKDALEALKTAKPYLFGAKDAAWGMKLGGASAEPVSRARMIAQNYYKNKYGEEKR